MCATCGCSSGGTVQLLVAGHPPHAHPGHAHTGSGPAGHDHHDHPHPGEFRALEAPDGPRTIELQQKVLAKNDELAEQNRAWLAGRGILAINLMSSPGAGKTTLLEATMRGMAGKA